MEAYQKNYSVNEKKVILAKYLGKFFSPEESERNLPISKLPPVRKLDPESVRKNGIFYSFQFYLPNFPDVCKREMKLP